MNKVAHASEQVAAAFDDWLKAEVATSGDSRNRYLDNFEEMRYRLTLGSGHTDNWSSQKEIAHMQRLPQWFETYQSEPVGSPQAEYLSARQLFGPLMFLSGSHRVASYIQARDKYDYMDRRSTGVDVDLEAIVHAHFNLYLPKNGNFAEAELTIEQLAEQQELALKLGEIAMRNVSARLALDFDMSESNSRSVRELVRHQYIWSSFATSCVIVAAKLRKGELEAVPFLEPVSITDQSGSIYYPLRGPINWAEVLAA